jgi:hypothetical protein
MTDLRRAELWAVVDDHLAHITISIVWKFLSKSRATKFRWRGRFKDHFRATG